MATLTIRQENRTLTEADAISRFLGQFGIWYRRSDLGDELGDAAGHEEILAAYEEPIRELEAEGGYVTADVIDITPETPNLEVMLARFDKEHWHDEDEVRFIVAGRGLFHIHPADGPVFSLEIEAGDMINVPRGTHHWFDLCDERRIRAIRLFQDTSGWTPHYTGSGEETKHQPLCFGPAYIGVERVPEKLRP
jgi:1,2-dihydroxy-3-keto-5-methylthiopentene dioxygenase